MNRLLTFTTIFQISAIIFGVLLAAIGVKLWDSSYPEAEIHASPRAVLWARWFSSYGALLLIPIVMWFAVVWNSNQERLKIPLTEKMLTLLCLILTITALVIGLLPGLLIFAVMNW